MAQQETQPLAMCLTERWLKDDSNIKCSSLSSYQLLDTSNRQIGKGGGVAIFVSEGVVKTVLQKFSSRNCQLLTIKIERKNYTSNRQIGKGGGVAIFVSEGVVKTVLQKFSSRNCQLLTIKIERKNYENDLVLTVVYLKPNTSLSEFSKTFEEYFEMTSQNRCI